MGYCIFGKNILLLNESCIHHIAETGDRNFSVAIFLRIVYFKLN